MRRNRIEILVASCAIVISAASLYIAVRQNALMERQLSASTWPVLEFGTSNVDDEGHPEISFEIRNAGLGPAKVRSFELWLGDQALKTSREILNTCCSDEGVVPRINLVTTGVNHTIVTANQTVRFFRF